MKVFIFIILIILIALVLLTIEAARGALTILSLILLLLGALLLIDRFNFVREIRRLKNQQAESIKKVVDGFSLAFSEFSMGNLTVRVERDRITTAQPPKDPLLLPIHEQFALIGKSIDGNIKELTDMTHEPLRRVHYIGADSYLEGRRCGELMEELLGGEGQVAILVNSFSNIAHTLRQKGFGNYLLEHAKRITTVEICEEKEISKTTFEVTARLLEKYPRLSGIYITEGTTPFAAAKAVEAAHGSRQVRIVAHDLTASTAEYIKRDIISASLSQRPYIQGYDTVIRLCNHIISGEAPTIDRILTKLEVVTSENLHMHWDEAHNKPAMEHEKSSCADLLPSAKDVRLVIGVILPGETGFWEPVADGVRDAQERVSEAGGVVKIMIPPGDENYMNPAFYVKMIDDFVCEGCNGICLPVFNREIVGHINGLAGSGTRFASYNAEPVGFRGMIESVSGKIKHLFSISEGLASMTVEGSQAASHIDETMKKILSRTKDQVGIFSRAHAALESLIKSVSEISSLSSRTAQGAEETRTSAMTGSEIVVSINGVMDEISNMTNTMSTIVSQFNTNVQKIRDMTVFIDEIATRTNMIAINASILAAKYGKEAGGFAVVAQEVRKLAEQSRQGTERISDVIHTILGNMDEVMDMMQREQNQILKAGAESGRAGSALENIISASRKNEENIGLILSAIADTHRSSENVMGEMGAFAEISIQNSGAIEQITASISELSVTVSENSTTAQNLSNLAQAQEDIFVQFFTGKDRV